MHSNFEEIVTSIKKLGNDLLVETRFEKYLIPLRSIVYVTERTQQDQSTNFTLIFNDDQYVVLENFTMQNYLDLLASPSSKDLEVDDET